MTLQAILEMIHNRRRELNLSQKELASKLGITQSQISNLERAAVDPRLSTLQDIVRVLDLELVLVPRKLIPTIEGLIRRKELGIEDRPIYALTEGSTENGEDGR